MDTSPKIVTFGGHIITGFAEFHFSMRNQEAVVRVRLCDIQTEYCQ
jgi:hypothetical protein